MIIIGVMLVPLSAGNISIGMFIGLVNATLNLIQMMSWHLSDVTKALANNREYLKDLTEFCSLSEQPGALDKPIKTSKTKFETIEFKNVNFKYPGTEKYILKNCSFTLKKNLHYAFVGINGAGKTTITKLLTGMYDNFEGEILINGKSIKEYEFAEIKGLFSVVYQDFSRYYITVKDNIALGNVTEINEKNILHNLSVVGLDSAIEKLPAGINSYLGKIKDSGVDLSGGQWQRVAISRGFFRNHQIIILDEPTAAIDPYEETRIYNRFAEMSKDKTAVIVTHRLGSVRLANRIVVMKGGEVVEIGTHKELLEAGGEYARLYKAQQQWYVDDKEYSETG